MGNSASLTAVARFAGLLLASTWVLMAQTASTGALVGTVTDRSGAVVPGTEVAATNEATGEVRMVVSGAQGYYRIPLLSPGAYRIDARMKGFKTATIPGLVVRVTEALNSDISLEVGAATDSVTVEAGGLQVDTEKATLGRVVENSQIVSLPLVTRNYQHIMSFSPGVISNVPNSAAVGRGSIDVFTHGARATDNSFLMDGLQVNNFHTNRSAGVAVPSPDTIEEFKVQTGQYDASFGRQPGANVSIVTKGGSNDFHATFFEFFRNEKLNANDFFVNLVGGKKPVLRQNQFGGTFGGPIVKSKLLFFVSYQGTRQRNGLGAIQSVFFPKGFGADRSRAALGAAFGGQRGANGGTAIAPDGSNINPIALAILSAKLPDGSLVVPNPQIIQADGRGFSTYSSPTNFQEDQFNVNMDYLRSDKQTLKGRFFFANAPRLDFLTRNVPGWPLDQQEYFRNISLTHTYTITPRLLNEARLGAHRTRNDNLGISPISPTSVGLPVPNPDLPHFPLINVSGTFGLGTATTSANRQLTFNFSDSISWTHGRHFLRAGFDLSHVRDNFFLWQLRHGTLTFWSFPDFLLGMSAAQNGSAFSNLQTAEFLTGITDRALRVTDWSGFVQDDWKVTPRLTLNIGVRMERMNFPSELHGKLVDFWPELAATDPPPGGTLTGFVAPANYVEQFGNPPAGVTVIDNNCGLKKCSHNTWGPRFGFAWQPLARTKRIVVRGGYGLYYTRLQGNNQLQLVTNIPFVGAFRMSAASAAYASFQDPWFPSPPNSAYPIWRPRMATDTTNGTEFIAADFQPPVVQQWSFNIQTEFKRSYLLEVGYVGARGSHIWGFRWPSEPYLASPENPIRGVTTNTIQNISQRVPYQGFAGTGILEVASSGNYFHNGLDVSLNKRFSKGLQLLASYTFSKTLDDVHRAQDSATFGGWFSNDQRNPRQRRGPAQFARPHRLVLSYLYDLPSPKAHVVKQVLGGWHVSGVTTIQSGYYLTVTDTNSGSIYGWPQFDTGRAQLAPGVTAAQVVTSGPVDKRLNGYFNPAAFINPPAIGNGFDFGNAGRGIALGPDQRNFDFSVGKRTLLGWPSERANMEFRTEFFNVFNTPQFANPVENRALATFGRITASAVAPRVIQFGLKLIF